MKDSKIKVSEYETLAQMQFEQIASEFKNEELFVLYHDKQKDQIKYRRCYARKGQFLGMYVVGLKFVTPTRVNNNGQNVFWELFPYYDLQNASFYPSSCFCEILSKSYKLRNFYIDEDKCSKAPDPKDTVNFKLGIYGVPNDIEKHVKSFD